MDRAQNIPQLVLGFTVANTSTIFTFKRVALLTETVFDTFVILNYHPWFITAITATTTWATFFVFHIFV